VKETTVGGARGRHRNHDRANRCRLSEPSRSDEPGPELPERGRDRQDAMFGVGSAPAWQIEVGNLGRRAPSGVVEQRIEVGQPEAPADEGSEEEERGEPPGEPGHGLQSTERRSVCLLLPRCLR
jgi:hypothetical protein